MKLNIDDTKAPYILTIDKINTKYKNQNIKNDNFEKLIFKK